METPERALPALREEYHLQPTEILEAEVRVLTDTSETVLRQYQANLAKETRRRHVHDLAVFCRFLWEKWHLSASEEHLSDSLEAWRRLSVDKEMARAYFFWLQEDGFSLGSVNTRFTTFRVYCRLLQEAGILDTATYAQIGAMQLIRGDRYRSLNQNREARGVSTRKPDAKKEQWVYLNPEQVDTLLRRIGEQTVEARRDSLMIRLSWFYALRVSEMCALRLSSLDEQGILTLDRPKTHLYDQRLQLKGKSLELFLKVRQDRLEETTIGEEAPLFASYKYRGKDKDPQERASLPQILTARVKVLARKHLGIERVSMHDGRHSFATETLSDPNISLADVMDAAGWKTTAMPMIYRQRNKIANANITLES